jgi:cytochrome c-type protein NapB
MNTRFWLLVLATISATVSFELGAENRETFETTLRGNQDLMRENPAPEFRAQEQSPNRRVRDYPMQPPTIPHAIEGYVVSKDMNQCLMCHGATIAPQMKAPAVAVSHYQNRDGQYLKDISPRRYFCTQCHVPQTTNQPLVENSF